MPLRVWAMARRGATGGMGQTLNTVILPLLRLLMSTRAERLTASAHGVASSSSDASSDAARHTRMETARRGWGRGAVVGLVDGALHTHTPSPFTRHRES